MKNKKSVKINIVYNDVESKPQIESVWAEKVNENYKIANIPFFAYNIAYGDIVSVEEEDGQLYFYELIASSGHSTIQMIITDKNDVKEIGDQLVDLGCDCLLPLWPGRVSQTSDYRSKYRRDNTVDQRIMPGLGSNCIIGSSPRRRSFM